MQPPETTAPASAGRRYGGLTAEERRAARHAQLIEAGVELFGTVGYAGTSIRAVLRESGLAERYFYENFESLEQLLLAVHEHVHQVVAAEVARATEHAGDDVEARARAGLRAFVETLMTDPRWVRLKLQEHGGSAGEALRQFHQQAANRYASLLVAYGPDAQTRARGLQPRPLALAVLAGVESLLDGWAAGDFPMTLDELIDHATVLIVGTHRELADRA